MKALIIVVVLCAGGYFAWSYYKPPVEIKKAEPANKQEQAVQPQPQPPAKSEAELAKEREEAAKKQAEEAAAKLKAEQEAAKNELAKMKTDLAAKKEEWRKLKEERKKYTAALSEAKDKGWSNIDAIPERQAECKAAFEKFQGERKKFAGIKDKIEDAEKAVKRAASETNSFAKSTNEMVGWKYVGDSYVHPMKDLPNRDKKRPIKYIEGKGMSKKQQAEVDEKKHALAEANNALKSGQAAFDNVEKEYKTAGEKYEAELTAKINECKAKSKTLMEEGKAIEAKLSEAGEGKDADKDDDEG